MAMIEAEPILSQVTEHNIVLEGVSWRTYERLLKGIGEQRVHVTYDNGMMEIERSPSRKHESDADFLRSLVTLISAYSGAPIEAGGATTHKREDLAKGVEPDGCYWIAHEREMRGVDELDLTKHPPPDLVIEVDITSRSVNKIAIYAQLGVPEIWHETERDELVFLVLDPARNAYDPSEKSLSFGFLERSMVAAAMKRSEKDGQTAALNQLLQDLGLR